MAVLHYDATKREVSILQKLNLPIGTFPVLGHGLAIFFDQLTSLLAPVDATVFVREKAVISHIADTDRLLRVGGVADVALWQVKRTGWHELAPTTVKKIVTGKGTATKAMVARYLKPYVGDQVYETDDESDAVAVGVAFLLREGYLDEKRDTVSD